MDEIISRGIKFWDEHFYHIDRDESCCLKALGYIAIAAFTTGFFALVFLIVQNAWNIGLGSVYTDVNHLSYTQAAWFTVFLWFAYVYACGVLQCFRRAVFVVADPNNKEQYKTLN